jgi:hypothetical protein
MGQCHNSLEYIFTFLFVPFPLSLSLYSTVFSVSPSRPHSFPLLSIPTSVPHSIAHSIPFLLLHSILPYDRPTISKDQTMTRQSIYWKGIRTVLPSAIPIVDIGSAYPTNASDGKQLSLPILRQNIEQSCV